MAPTADKRLEKKRQEVVLLGREHVEPKETSVMCASVLTSDELDAAPVGVGVLATDRCRTHIVLTARARGRVSLAGHRSRVTLKVVVCSDKKWQKLAIDPANDAERIQWVRDYYQAMAPYSEPGGYINFMQDDDYDKTRDNYRENYERLVDVKRKYDPANLFHINQNIKP